MVDVGVGVSVGEGVGDGDGVGVIVGVTVGFPIGVGVGVSMGKSVYGFVVGNGVMLGVSDAIGFGLTPANGDTPEEKPEGAGLGVGVVVAVGSIVWAITTVLGTANCSMKKNATNKVVIIFFSFIFIFLFIYFPSIFLFWPQNPQSRILELRKIRERNVAYLNVGAPLTGHFEENDSRMSCRIPRRRPV